MSYCKTNEKESLEKAAKGFMVLWILTVVILAPLSFFTGVYVEYKEMTKQAIENNVAEWVVNNKTGIVDFKYKTNGKIND
jgi:ABC-type phosphate transport system permease subunit